MMRRFVFALMIVGGIAPQVQAQETTTVPALLDVTRLTAGVDSFTVLMQGKAVGWQRHTRTRTRDGWEVRDAIALGTMISQESIVIIALDGPERSLRQSGTMRGKPMTIALDFAPVATGTRVRGTADTPSNAAGVLAIDTVALPGTVDDNAVTPLLPGMRWREQLDAAVPVLASGKGTTSPTRLTVVGRDTVTVPAGTFAVWRIQQESAGTRVLFDVTREAPYRLVRMQQVGAPLEIVLVSSRAGGPGAH